MGLTAKHFIKKWFPKEIKTKRLFYYYKLKALRILGQQIGMWGPVPYNSFASTGKPIDRDLLYRLFLRIHEDNLHKHQYVALSMLLDYYFPPWRNFATKEVIGMGIERINGITRIWRKEVLKRDDYKCTECSTSENLQAHHIYEWADFPGLRIDVENGVTLCGDCHHKEHPNMAIEIFTKNLKIK